jgi:4-phytase / acid phosphatase
VVRGRQQTGVFGPLNAPVCIFFALLRDNRMTLGLRSHVSSVWFALLACAALTSFAQAPAPGAAHADRKLQFVIYLSRHGVRSPTGKAAQYNQYSAAPWPEWSVQPGYLTAHGFELMKLFGAYDRQRLAAAGLLAAQGCEDAARVTIVADSDQRTRETGKAVGEGMLPGCAVEVHARPEGSNDPLFHPLEGGVSDADRELAVAAIAGRIGGDANNITEAYRPQLKALDSILAGCGSAAGGRSRTSLLDVPASLAQGSGDHPAALRGPLAVASTLSENLLLEYTEGMRGADLGWGCLDEAKLRQAMQLHAAAADFSERTPAIARLYAKNLLEAIVNSLEQSAWGKPVAGALSKPRDSVLFLSGHDTNIAAVAGALGLTWIIDGRRDDTPPGGALVFELWRRASGAYSVRVFYTAQTLLQMREAQALTQANPPAQAPVFVPGCGTQDGACTLEEFAGAVHQVIAARAAGARP